MILLVAVCVTTSRLRHGMYIWFSWLTRGYCSKDSLAKWLFEGASANPLFKLEETLKQCKGRLNQVIQMDETPSIGGIKEGDELPVAELDALVTPHVLTQTSQCLLYIYIYYYFYYIYKDVFHIYIYIYCCSYIFEVF